MSDNFYVSGPEWFLFLYFKYWYFHSLKRFWDCDFNFVNVLELSIAWKNDKWYNKRVLIWHFTLVLIKINYGQIGDQKGSFTQQTQYFIHDSRSGRNQCFSVLNWFLPDLSLGPACLGISGYSWHKPVGLLTCDILDVRGRFYWPGPLGFWLNSKTEKVKYISIKFMNLKFKYLTVSINL
jgi:hypothetical protein